MKISNIRVEHPNESPEIVRLSATVSYGLREVTQEQCWFEFPGAFRAEISLTGDPWLACFLPVAMTLGEPLEIEAPVDARLFRSMMEVMAIWKTWYPQLSKVPVCVEQEIRPCHQGPIRSGAFFSGGVDSLFALIWNKEEREHQIDELLSVWGFDIPIEKKDEFAAHSKRLEKVSDHFGTPLVTIKTNLRKTVFSRAAWGELGCGPALAAVGLAIAPRYGIMLAANDQTYDRLFPWGAHELTFPRFSTATLSFIFFGGEFSRIERTRYIAQFPICLENLHVCWKEADDKNCCNCNKCYRTMAVLEVMGKLGEATTFDASQFSLQKLAKVFSGSFAAQLHFRDVLAFAEVMERKDLARAVKKSLRYSRLVLCLLPFVRSVKTRISYTLGHALEMLLKKGAIQ
jgi:hypothetical protein